LLLWLFQEGSHIREYIAKHIYIYTKRKTHIYIHICDNKRQAKNWKGKERKAEQKQLRN